MSRRLALGSVLALALTLSSSRAAAWTPIDGTRPVWSGAVPYQLNDAGSADLGLAASESTVRRAFDDWTAVSCTDLAASYGGTTPSRPITGDGRAIVGWVESGWRYDRSAIGVTQPQWTTRTGSAHPTIVEADMELNGVGFTWITGLGGGGAVDAYSIVLHEAGHYYGLGHSSDSSAAMYFAYSGGTSTLGADDETGICALYPAGTPLDCHTTGCASGQTCQADGTCSTTGTGGGLCARCDNGATCASGACIRYPDGLGYCGATCTADTDCGAEARCFTVTGLGRQCVRVSGTQPSCAGVTPGCTNDTQCASGQRCNTASGVCEAGSSSGGGLGAPCSVAGDCASDVCLSGVCSATCDWLVPSSCGTGFYCNGQATGTCTGTGLCVAGSAGGGATGSACSANTDCAGLFCAEGVCTQPCVPEAAGSSCPVGYACQVGSTARCGSCQMTGQLGDACAMGTDCTSRICVDGACSRTCDPLAAGSCPAMFECVAQGESGACLSMSGGLGAPCADAADCLDGQCAQAGSRSFCTRACDALAPCPRNYTCVASGDGTTRVCQPRATAGCGCSAVGESGRSPWMLGALGLLAAARRRRAAPRFSACAPGSRRARDRPARS